MVAQTRKGVLIEFELLFGELLPSILEVKFLLLHLQLLRL